MNAVTCFDLFFLLVVSSELRSSSEVNAPIQTQEILIKSADRQELLQDFLYHAGNSMSMTLATLTTH